jgi:prephenate dehydratase
VDIEGHGNDSRVLKALKVLHQHCSLVKVLGSYPDSE